MKSLYAFLLLAATTFPNNILAGTYGTGVRTVYSSTNVGTSNWVVLSNGQANTVSSIVVVDTSGQVMEIGTAPVGSTANSEVRQFLVPTGGIGVKIIIPPTQRISIRAVSSTATTGENDLSILY